jgi:hypothetical protein
MLFDYFQVNYMYLYTLFSAFFKLVPVISTNLIGAIGAIQLYYSHGRPLWEVLILGSAYYYVDLKLQSDIYLKLVEQSGAKPYLIGMSVFLGYYAFDLQGIFYGPLIVCLLPMVYKNFAESNQQLDEVEGTPDQMGESAVRKGSSEKRRAANLSDEEESSSVDGRKAIKKEKKAKGGKKATRGNGKAAKAK